MKRNELVDPVMLFLDPKSNQGLGSDKADEEEQKIMEDRITSSNWYVPSKFKNRNKKKGHKNRTPSLIQGKRIITADDAHQDHTYAQRDDLLEVQQHFMNVKTDFY